MPDVHVKGLDEPIFFPDTMSPEDIQGALRKKFPPQAQPDAPQELNYNVYRPEPSLMSKALDWAPAVTRVGSSFLGSTPVVGGIFGAAGEALAQAEEKALQHRDIYDPKAITAQGLVGMIPGGAAGRLGWQMLKGGAKGLTAVTVPAVVERHQLPTKEEALGGIAVGAALPLGIKGYQTWKARGAGKEMSAYLTKKLGMEVGNNDHDRIAGLALLREQELTDVAKKEGRAQLLGVMQGRQGLPGGEPTPILPEGPASTPTSQTQRVLTTGEPRGGIGSAQSMSTPTTIDVPELLDRLASAANNGGEVTTQGKLFALGAEYTSEGLRRAGLNPPQIRALIDANVLQRGRAGYALNKDMVGPEIDQLRAAGAIKPAGSQSVLQMASTTLRGQGGSTNLFGDWARRIVGGGEPDALKNVPFVDLAVQHARAQAEGKTALAAQLQQALVSRVPSAAIGKQIEKWFDVKTAAKAMRNPKLSGLTGDNGFEEVTMWTNAAVQQTAAINNSPGMKLDDRVSRQVAYAFLNHDIEPDDAMKVMMEKGLSLTEFVSDVLLETSRSGRILQRMSHLRKSLNALTVDSPQSQDALDALTLITKPGGGPGTGPITTPERLGWKVRDAIDIWRGAMVVQPKTFARNVTSQAGASVSDMMDLAFMGEFRGATNIAIMQKRYMVDGATHFGRFVQGMPGKADELEKIFAAFPIQGKQIMSTPTAEATLGKYMAAANFLNTTQEQFFRRSRFAAHVKTWAEANGTDLATALNNPQMVPKQIVEDGARHAMRMTFSAVPESNFGKAYVSAFQQYPVLYALTPYPRFQANALRFLYEHAPLGLAIPSRYINAQRKAAQGSLEHIASFKEMAAQSMTGTVLWGGAMALRFSPLAGEHWYTVKHDDGSEQDVRTPDTKLQRDDQRAYAPFAGMLFGSELLKNYGLYGEPRMNDQDLKAGIQALMLRGGTGYSLAEIFFGNDPVSSIPKATATIAGNLLGGVTVPLRLPKDIVSSIEYAVNGTSEEAKYRDVREHPIIGPMMQNVPGVSRFLPESPNPLVPGEAYQNDYPLLGQATGISRSDITPIEAETARLGLSSKTIAAHSGNPQFDRKTSRIMAKPASRAAWNVMQNPDFQRSSRDYQAAWLNEEIDKTRSIAGRVAAPPGSPLWREMQLERKPATRREIHRQRAIERQTREALQ